MSVSFSLEQTRDGDGVSIFELKGALNHSSYPELKAKLKEEFEASCFFLILDFSAVTTLSSLVLGSLFTHHQLLNSHQGGMVLCGCSESIYSILQALSLDESFHLADDLDSAREFLKQFKKNGV